jgi:glycosyltransferase involved in cell wall biosynthesis
LKALAAQEPLPPACEVVIVDDGSRDDTPAAVEGMRARLPIPLGYERQDPRGPAAARNLGLRLAHGDIVLFLGDDIIADPALLAAHLQSHMLLPDPRVAVLGFVTWSPSIDVTPYMHWLETSGNQFDYGRLRPEEDVDPARFFYTANLSVKRKFLADTHEYFDERFRHALLEDIDLGKRLACHGLRLRYNPDARAFHEHAVSLAGYVRRIERSSEYRVLLDRPTPSGSRTRGSSSPSTSAPRRRRNYFAYAWFLVRVVGEILRNWPFYLAARIFERRRLAPVAFTRAHRHWAHRGLLRLEAKRAFAKLTSAT